MHQLIIIFFCSVVFLLLNLTDLLVMICDKRLCLLSVNSFTDLLGFAKDFFLDLMTILRFLDNFRIFKMLLCIQKILLRAQEEPAT